MVKLRFFAVPVHDRGAVATELNQFLASHRILATDRNLVPGGANSVWAVCVSYDDAIAPNRPAASIPTQARGNKVGSREVLGEQEFAVFPRLQALRKEMAEQEGVPAYALFTNDQLARIVQQRVHTLTALPASSTVTRH
jgi:superfamily II DNA helicase RecQ